LSVIRNNVAERSIVQLMDKKKGGQAPFFELA